MSQNYKYFKQGDIKKHIEVLKKISLIIDKREYSNAIYDTQYGHGDFGQYFLYQELGNLYYSLFKYDKALDYFYKAKQVLKGDNIKYISYIHNDVAKVYIQLGQYQKAINLLKEDFLKEKDYNIGENLITAYIGVNQLEEALKVAQEIFNTRLKQNNDTSILDCEKYNLLGNIYLFMKKYKKALKYYNYPLLVAKKNMNINSQQYFNRSQYYMAKMFGLPYKDLSQSYFNIAMVYYQTKKYSKTIDYFKKALKTIKNQPYMSEIIKISIKRYLAWSILESNNYQDNNRSLTLFNEIINKKRSMYGEDSLSTDYYSLSAYYNIQNMNREAYKYIKKSYDIFIKSRHRNFALLNSLEKQKYLMIKEIPIMYLLEMSYQYKIYNKLDSIKEKKLLETTLTDWLQYKGTLFEYKNLLSMIENSPKADTKTKQNIKKLKRLTIRLDNLDSSDRPPKNYKDKKKFIEKQIHNIEVNLSKQNKKFKEQLNLKDINYADISTQLKPNQLYIDFAKGEYNYYIFTLDSGNNITFEKVSQNSIDSNITKFLEINKKIEKDVANKELVKNLKPQTTKILFNLYNLLITKNIEQNELIISPDGLLNFLPFEALFDGEKYLIENYTISYISSGREFIRQAKRDKRRDSSEVVLFGSPNFEYGIKGVNPTTLSPFDSQTYPQLDSSKEIEVIKKYYHNAKIYQEENASVENLMQIKNPKILHLSTHGFFFDDKTILNPMRRSGLALSSANRAEYESNRTGLITALKLSSMELYNTELVVLSACETGLGTIQKAEGVVGLPKAFIQAGARKVVMSLWKVSEQKTALLMEKFYTHIVKGEDYTLALRDAKLEMIERHPYYWSAFILSGI